MGISIKHDEIERLIRELAARRGGGITDAIGAAVRAELDREKRMGSVDDYLAAVRKAQSLAAAAPLLDPRTPDEIIGYDEHGAPM